MGVKKTQQMYKDTHRSTHNVRSIHSSSHVDMANLHNTRGFSFSQPWTNVLSSFSKQHPEHKSILKRASNRPYWSRTA